MYMRFFVSIFLLSFSNLIWAQSYSYSSLSRIKTINYKNSLTTIGYDKLGNRTSKITVLISGSEDIENESVNIVHEVTEEEVEIIISDGVNGKVVRVYNSNNEEILVIDEGSSSRKTSSTFLVDVSTFEQGIYYFNVFDSIGVQLARKQIEIKDPNSIENLQAFESLNIFPNPTSDKITIEFGEIIPELYPSPSARGWHKLCIFSWNN